MEFVADLHLHSKYSRAVSRDMVLPTMQEWATRKGIDVLSTADWTHPLWFREIRSQLEEKSDGLFQLKSNIKSSSTQYPYFLLSVEVSSIYSQGGRLRRIHNLIFSPSFETSEKINKELLRRGCNLMSDGRPIFGISSEHLIELVFSIDRRAMLIPCHAWTPWFSLYGSNSGFDSIQECFGRYSDSIFGIETGLSSDPEMNWRIEDLDTRSILSFSDAHSPAKMGREATVFKTTKDDPSFQISFNTITSAIKREPNRALEIGHTIEFYPEEGKYHYNGHRNCNIVQTPQETKEKGAICPVCKRNLTVGVMHRVQELAVRPENEKLTSDTDELGVVWYRHASGRRPPFVKLVPLLEIIAESMESTVSSGKVKQSYLDICKKFGSEFRVLLKTPLTEIRKFSSARIAEAIGKVRSGTIAISPGFDGEFGKVKIWNQESTILKKKSELKEDNQLGLAF